MFKSLISITLFTLTALSLIGCSPVAYRPIAPAPALLKNPQSKRVLVVSTELPEASMNYVGQIGLLDRAIIAAASSSQNTFLSTLDLARARSLGDTLGKRLENFGFQVRYLDKRPERSSLEKYRADEAPELHAPVDFRKYGGGNDKADYVLLVDLYQTGTERSYYGFIPLTPPSAIFRGRAMLASTRDNKLAWLAFESASAPIPDPWDQAPEFPNLGSTVLRNMNEALARIESSLFPDLPATASAPAANPAAPITPRPPAAPAAKAPSPVAANTSAPALIEYLRVKPASGFARLEEIDKVPMRMEHQVKYEKFLANPSPTKALVLGEKGGFFSTEDGTLAALHRIFERCHRTNRECWLYAWGSQVVWSENPEQRISLDRLKPLSPHGLARAHPAP